MQHLRRLRWQVWSPLLMAQQLYRQTQSWLLYHICARTSNLPFHGDRRSDCILRQFYHKWLRRINDWLLNSCLWEYFMRLSKVAFHWFLLHNEHFVLYFERQKYDFDQNYLGIYPNPVSRFRFPRTLSIQIVTGKLPNWTDFNWASWKATGSKSRLSNSIQCEWAPGQRGNSSYRNKIPLPWDGKGCIEHWWVAQSGHSDAAYRS